jgi:hypothetical protein
VRGLKQPGIFNMHNFCNLLGIPLDELRRQKTRTLHIELSEEERDTMLSMIDECKHESEISYSNPKPVVSWRGVFDEAISAGLLRFARNDRLHSI